MRLIINSRRVIFGAGCLLAVLALIAAGCGNDDDDDVTGVPTVIATTSIWADVAANVACDGLAEVSTIIPPGGDPHAFQPSLSDRGNMEDAALIVANGLFLEEGLEDTIDAVEEAGTPVFRVADHVSVIEFGSAMGHEDHDEDEHEDHDEDEHEDHDDHDEEEGHDHDEEEGHDHDEGRPRRRRGPRPRRGRPRRRRGPRPRRGRPRRRRGPRPRRRRGPRPRRRRGPRPRRRRHDHDERGPRPRRGRTRGRTRRPRTCARARK